MLFRYAKSCSVKTRGKQYWTGCTDKAAVGGFSLQATLFAFEDNIAVVPPPAVCLRRVVVSYGQGGLDSEVAADRVSQTPVFGVYTYRGSVFFL